MYIILLTMLFDDPKGKEVDIWQYTVAKLEQPPKAAITPTPDQSGDVTGRNFNYHYMTTIWMFKVN